MSRLRKQAVAMLLSIFMTVFVYPNSVSAAGTISVGQNSSSSKSFIDAFNRVGGANRIGSPINSVHTWGAGCIQDFRGGWSGRAAIMQANCKGNAYVVLKSMWAYLESRWGGNATTEIGYPTGDDFRSGNGWVQHFTGGNWRNTSFAKSDQTCIVRSIRGDTRYHWLSNGGAIGKFGYPLGEDYIWNGIYKQDFQGGSIIWDPINKARQYNPPAPAPTREQKAASWAVSEKNSPNPRWSDEFGRAWSGYCEGFTEVAYNTRGQFTSAYAHYLWQLNNGRIHTDTTPPAGALVFYSGGGGYGHIGVSIGSGQVISTQGFDGQYLPVWQHSVTGLSSPYLGWAYAPNNWSGR